MAAGLAAENLGPFMSNIYLAEDRILCFELIARHGVCAYVNFCPKVPQMVAVLGGQKFWRHKIKNFHFGHPDIIQQGTVGPPAGPGARCPHPHTRMNGRRLAS